MSATLNPELFLNYFADVSKLKEEIPVIKIETGIFPVFEYYLDELEESLQYKVFYFFICLTKILK